MLRTILLLLISGASYAQAPTPTSGVVREAATSAVVPYAVVEIPTRHLGVQADQDSHFSFVLPTDLQPTDSLTVSALGYRRQRLTVPTTSPWRVVLSPLPVALREVVVHGTKAAPVLLGPREKVKHGGFGNDGLAADRPRGWQVARFFAQPPAGQLTAVRFYVKRGLSNCPHQLSQAPFRVRVYAADGPAGTPGTDLLTQTVMAAAPKPGWLTVDLTPFNLPTSTSGFFVAMEWLYTDARYFCQTTALNPTTKESRMSTHYGQSLGGYWRAQGQNAAWYLAAGYPWQKMRPFAPSGKPLLFGEPAIQAIIQP